MQTHIYQTRSVTQGYGEVCLYSILNQIGSKSNTYLFIKKDFLVFSSLFYFLGGLGPLKMLQINRSV